MNTGNNATSRREFIKVSSKAAAGIALANTVAARCHAAEKNTIKIALVGCGGRGTGAAGQALSTKGPTKLWAMADVFDHRLNTSLKTISAQHETQVDVPPERRFIGMDAYKRAIDSLDKGDVVLLTTPPAFRPLHLEYAAQKGVNVFMEKSFAVDAPGIRRVLRAGGVAEEKGLKIAGGLMERHYAPLEEAVAHIHDGMIGKLIMSYAYRMHGPVGLGTRSPDVSEMAYQIMNYSCFTWLNGSFIVDWLIHNIDVACWAKGALPVSVQGMGGRQARKVADQLFDHYGAEYTFPDGTRMLVQGRHIAGCWEYWGDVIHGAEGTALIGEGIPQPRIYKGHEQTQENLVWQFKDKPPNPYQVEHDLFFDAIRNDRRYNETRRCAESCLAAIMGRMACESGKRITWEEAMNSDLELAPGLDDFTMDSKPPVVPDAEGRYPVAMPGETKAL
ncbi:MAG: gfo/Idh/MocA family oxidoreductase [Verrucomicrobia bacterium]|nr:gfo/Idh/MocA family oxidoreductase [Verrucomicrobiota bacterium]MCF7709439.1 gfo/Idh/MocA family oxidoreductase [Verrucomicrobiota bacterium]